MDHNIASFWKNSFSIIFLFKRKTPKYTDSFLISLISKHQIKHNFASYFSAYIILLFKHLLFVMETHRSLDNLSIMFEDVIFLIHIEIIVFGLLIFFCAFIVNLNVNIN